MKKDALPQRILLFIDAACKAITQTLSLTQKDVVTLQPCLEEDLSLVSNQVLFFVILSKLSLYMNGTVYYYVTETAHLGTKLP